MRLMTLVLALAMPALAAAAPPEGLEAPKKAHWEAKGKASGLFFRGQSALERGALKEAETRMREALDAQPGCGAALVALASALEGQAKRDDAVDVMLFAQELFPNQPEVAVAAAASQLSAMHPEQAATAALRALELAPGDFEAARIHTLAAAQLGRTADGLAVVERTRAKKDNERYPCLEVALHTAAGDHEAAEGPWGACDKLHLRPALEAAAFRASQAREWSKLARIGRDLTDERTARVGDVLALLDEGAAHRATTTARLAHEADPHAVEPLAVYGIALARAGHLDKAEGALDALLTDERLAGPEHMEPRSTLFLAPLQVEALVASAAAERALLLHGSGDTAGARALLDKAGGLTRTPEAAALSAVLADPAEQWALLDEAWAEWPGAWALVDAMTRLDPAGAGLVPMEDLETVERAPIQSPQAGEVHCIVHALVAPNGTPWQVDLHHCGGLWAHEARKGLRQWRWTPPTQDGTPVRARVTGRLVFSESTEPHWSPEAGDPPEPLALPPHELDDTDRAAFEQALKRADTDVAACIRRERRWDRSFDRTIEATVSVTHHGKVAGVELPAELTPTLAACIDDAVSVVSFPRRFEPGMSEASRTFDAEAGTQ